MVNWLKYFFGGFFLHKYSRENERRNLLNSVLALALSFALFLSGLYLGYTASFSSHLNKSSQFANTIQQVFENGNLRLVVKGGVATSVDNPRPIDTFSGIGTAPTTGMQVVIDTNETQHNFAQFEVHCTLRTDSEKEISYEEYLTLQDGEKAKYYIDVKNLGIPLVFDQQKIEAYNKHLLSASDTQSPFYNVGITADYLALSKDQPNYDYQLYQLYVASYYPFMSNFERYAKAPSMKTYYTECLAEAEQYLVVLDDICIGRFTTDSGIAVEFSGFFVNVQEYQLNGTAQNKDELWATAKQLLTDAFNASRSNVMSVYVINSVTSFPIVVVAALVVAVAMWFAIKKCHGDFGFGASVKAVFSYFFVASVIVFALTLGLSFALPREMVYTFTVVGLFVIVLVRSAVFCVTECVLSLRNYRAEQQLIQ